jgi:transposase
VRARAGFGPEVHAQAANLACGNFIPAGRAARLMADMAGVKVSPGWIASVRAKAAALIESSGFTDLVADLLGQAEAVHADETPARAAGGLRYVHLACAPFLTRMHTGDRSADAADAGGVLPGCQGILVRDGYHQGYGHLTDALHAWCGAHLLRDLKDLYDFEPGKQDRAEQMAALLIEGRDYARDARAAGKKALDPDTLTGLTGRYREIATSGLASNVYRQTPTAKDSRRIARRFLKHEDMILRFITRPDLDIFSNNQAERDVRPVKVQQRASGGCWRTLEGLAEFAVVQSYLSTASKWGISRLDALRGLFSGNPWMPPGIAPEPSG